MEILNKSQLSTNNSVTKKKRRPSIPTETKTKLWLTSGGRCQFNGCNKPLWRNDVTMGIMNKSYIAHIYAFSDNGPRYDEILSPLLETDFANLMMVCDQCHRTFDDKDKVNEYPASFLIQMKQSHEKRIELLTGIDVDKKSFILLYGAKIGEHDSPLSFPKAAETIVPNFYPVSAEPLDIGLKNSAFKDNSKEYWDFQVANLVQLFREKVSYSKQAGSSPHYSIFALAPQPLLIKLGTLLSDLYEAEVYQLHRNPKTWKWLEEDVVAKFKLFEPQKDAENVALNISLSANISNDRIIKVLGENTAIWTITIDSPDNDFLRNRSQFLEFNKIIRKAFDQIKSRHGQEAFLNVFPAMPVALAVELGRVWMPKADMRLKIFDQNREAGGFIETLTIPV